MIAGGGGGAGASGKISFLTSNNVPYSYEVGPGGNGKNGDVRGDPGHDSSVTFSATEKIDASGGEGGKGWFNGNVGGGGGTLTIQGLNIIINGTSGNGGHGFRGNGVATVPSPSVTHLTVLEIIQFLLKSILVIVNLWEVVEPEEIILVKVVGVVMEMVVLLMGHV